MGRNEVEGGEAAVPSPGPGRTKSRTGVAMRTSTFFHSNLLRSGRMAVVAGVMVCGRDIDTEKGPDPSGPAQRRDIEDGRDRLLAQYH